ncbi:MAG: NADPH:quinone oxidoreductase family protein [Halioglobus sp.]|nr:NADPH:quinone oxidoreductase family protein [Halioglobus sp.]
MRAWQVTGAGSPDQVIEPGSRDVPEPGPGELQIEIAAAGMGLPDVLMCRGEYAYSPALPFTPGQEVAGVITEVGEDVDAAAIGRRVMGVTAFYSGHGGYAEYCLAPEFAVYPVPDGMSDAEAAAFGIPYHTAWVGLKWRADIEPGDVLLVHGGAGGTGSAAIQLGAALGARVIATAGSDDRLDFCRSLGADGAINYREADFAAAVLELTEGRGADVIYDPVGGEIFERSASCIAPGGRLLAVGFACGRWGAADTRALVMRNGSVMGVFVGAYGHDEMSACHAELAGLYAAGRITVPLAATIGFDEVGDYLCRLERREIRGKVVVVR